MPSQPSAVKAEVPRKTARYVTPSFLGSISSDKAIQTVM